VVSTGAPHRGRGDHGRFLSECKALMAQVGGIRRTGSATIDLAWVAAGRFDGYIEHGLEAWDMAAGMLLGPGAGGYASGGAGGPGAGGGVGLAWGATGQSVLVTRVGQRASRGFWPVGGMGPALWVASGGGCGGGGFKRGSWAGIGGIKLAVCGAKVFC